MSIIVSIPRNWESTFASNFKLWESYCQVSCFVFCSKCVKSVVDSPVSWSVNLNLEEHLNKSAVSFILGDGKLLWWRQHRPVLWPGRWGPVELAMEVDGHLCQGGGRQRGALQRRPRLLQVPRGAGAGERVDEQGDWSGTLVAFWRNLRKSGDFLPLLPLTLRLPTQGGRLRGQVLFVDSFFLSLESENRLSVSTQ